MGYIPLLTVAQCVGGCSMLEAHGVHPIVDCRTMCGCSMLEAHGVRPIVDCSTMCVGVVC